MEVPITKYAIITKRTDLKLHLCVNGMLQDEKEKITVEAGTLLKVLNAKGGRVSPSRSSSSGNKYYCTIQVLDYFNQNPIWENLYDCPQSNLKKIHEDMWPFAIGISDPHRRLQFLLNVEQCKYILYLRVNDLVSVSGEPFGNSLLRYDCIVRYIGLVQEIGPGYYFGLELLHLDSGYSPQAENIPFALNYMSCDPQLSLIITADWISQLPIEVKKKFSARELLCGTLEKARTVIGFNSSSSVVGGGKQTSSPLLRAGSTRKTHKKSNSKVEKGNEPLICANSQFYDTNQSDGYSSGGGGGIGSGSDQFDSAMDRRSINTNQNILPRIHTSTWKDKSTNTNFKDDSISSKKVPVTITPSAAVTTSKSISTAASFSTTSTPQVSIDKVQTLDKKNQSDEGIIISLDSDEFKQHVENYEKTLERHHELGNIPPVGILKTTKHRKQISGSSGDISAGEIPNSVTKPVNIMSLDGRDIIVIDKADIKESTKNEANVIVVDNPRQQKEVDLADLLGGNWPNNASDATFVLNKAEQTACGSNYVSSSSNSSVSSFNASKIDRNKSSNPLSHLVAIRTLERNRNRDNQWTQTVADSVPAENSASLRSKDKKLKNTIDPPLYDNVNVETTAVAVGGGAAPAATLASPEEEFIQSSPLHDIPGTSLGVGSMVEVSTDIVEDLYGVIRWIGSPPGHKSVYVGVELEDDHDDKRLPTTDGSFNGVRLFKCQDGRAVFVQPSQCSKDRRFVDIDTPHGNKLNLKQLPETKMFGQVECPPVPEDVPPLKIYNLDELEEVCGKFKGIQGHHNSCYLDATLFSMFTFTSVFDSLLYRPPEPEDISNYEEVQTVLREEIVNPLRKNVFVRADRVMKLRQLLDKLSSVSGLTSEEKDPEEFLNSLLAQIMRAEPFLKLSSGQDAFFYQLFVEKDERLSFPSVQQLFEQSFLSSDIKLKEVPSCLIIQMPRFGKNFKMYPRILPSQVLDVTDIIEDSPRQCSVCGKLAEYECRECFGILQCGVGLESTAFCRKCLETVHSHAKRSNHTAKEISVPLDFKIMAEHLTVPRLFMELFAVVCIETSHYVAFVKAGSGLNAPWCFFDSMADRKGEQNGYNIPEMICVPDLPQWLSEEGARTVNETSSNDKMLPEHAKRLFCDAYMCMYQSTDVMMYR